MKIDQNLRAAIRSFCSKSKSHLAYTQELTRNAKAIEELCSSEKWRDRIATVQEELKEIGERMRRDAEKVETHERLFREIGLFRCSDGELRIGDNDKFAKAGGRVVVEKQYNTDAIIAQLAVAKPEEGAKILKELGIVWE